MSPAPVIHAPMIHAPIYAPRMPINSSAGGTLGADWLRPPRRPVRPPVVVIYQPPLFPIQPFWGLNSCWWGGCDQFWRWALGYTSVVSYPGPTNYLAPAYEAPVYVYGEERPDLPQLFLKDGTILNVTDYWLIDSQLHFTIVGQDGKPEEHVIDFNALDLQTTVNANTRRGFRFMLRNEPFEQYVRDHPEGPPPVTTSPQK